MVRENKSISKDDILPPPRRENNHFRNIIPSKWLHPLVHFLRLLLVTPESDHAEFGLHLPRINLNHPHTARDQLFSEGVSEAAHRGFGRAVDAAARVRLAARDGPDVDDVAAAAVRAGEEEGEDGLGHCDQAGYVGLEHGVDVGLGDGGGFVDAFDEAAVPALISFGFLDHGCAEGAWEEGVGGRVTRRGLRTRCSLARRFP